jgi:hypothetical protein
MSGTPATPLVPYARSRSHPETVLYVIATHRVRDRSGTPPHRWVPYGQEHAWRAGERRTLCGEWTYGWTVFWDRQFSAGPASACPGCIEASLPEESRSRLDPRSESAPAPQHDPLSTLSA